MVDRTIVINAMVNGARIIPHPVIFKPKYGPKKANIPPFKIRDPIPKVQTKMGIYIFVISGHNIALKILMKNINNTTLYRFVTVKSNPKLIRYNPIKFAMNSTRYLFNDSPRRIFKFVNISLFLTSPFIYKSWNL